jgi:hypothetical protein
MPWERLRVFDELLDEPTGGGENDIDLTFPDLEAQPWRSRHILDTFGNSLKKVNRMYNNHFGCETHPVAPSSCTLT